jgi:N4-gp56 family major capsid protein
MADTLSNTTILDNLIATKFEKTALPRLVAKAKLYQFADKYSLAKGDGKTIVMNAWTNFTPVSAALTEGTNPSLAGLSSRKVTATIAEYGRGIKATDLVEYTSSIDVMKGAIENLGDSAGLSVDDVIQMAIFKNSLAGNTDARILSAWMSSVVSAFRPGTNTAESNATWGFSPIFATSCTRLSATKVISGGVGPGVSSRLSRAALRKVVKVLRANNVMEFADGYFVCISPTNAISDLASDPSLASWFSYSNPDWAKRGDAVAPVEGCRIVASNNMPQHSSAKHKNSLNFVFGKGAYGCVELGSGKGKGFEIIIKRPGPNDTSNPLNMYSTVSYKFKMVGVALNLSAGRILITSDGIK